LLLSGFREEQAAPGNNCPENPQRAEGGPPSPDKKSSSAR